jgi:plastocyanin
MRSSSAAACLLIALAGLASDLWAGTITGTVSAKAAEDSGAAGSGAYQSRKYKFVEKIDYERLEDFVVYIDQPVPGGKASGDAAKVVQKEAAFEPHVLPVMVGTTIRWPNEDDIYHNVFSMSDTKEFDLGLYKTEKEPALIFDKPGRVDVFCGIHSKMHCIILVVPSSYFVKVDVKRRFTISDVPAGTYKLRAWHERLPSRTLEVTVPETGEVKVDFVLGLGELPKY